MSVPVTIAIPTYRREQVLIDTIAHLLAQDPPAQEVLVLDQTPRHEPLTERVLDAWSAQGRIRWIRLGQPSIPCAMNCALAIAACDTVLFVDDDVLPGAGLVAEHCAARALTGAAAVAGRIVQPWDDDGAVVDRPGFHFAQRQPAWIEQFMGGNISIDRRIALSLGGFDENFVRVAYRFEAEFSHRLRKAGHRIYFAPQASLRHLKVTNGGTRTVAHHLRTWRPDHAVGRYYFLLRTWAGWPSLKQLAVAPARAVMTGHHLRRPWWIPVTLTAETLGLLWALKLVCQGPRYAAAVGLDGEWKRSGGG